MRLRTPVIFAATAAVIAGLLAASPAEARSAGASVTSSRVALSTSGNGKVAISCKGSRTCRGSLSFVGDAGTPRARSYRVRPGRTTHVSVALRRGASVDPYTVAAVPGRDVRRVAKARLKIAEKAPRRRTHYRSLATETLVRRQQITGRVTGSGPAPATDVRVELVKRIRGGNTVVVKGQDVPAAGGTFSLAVSLRSNNLSSNPYLLRVTGRDQDGQRRSWYWRGKNGRPGGGGPQVRDGSVIRATKWGDYVADVSYASISGTTAPGAEVRVASPPPQLGGRTTRRELDIAGCANFLGATRADGAGAYSVGFLPVTSSSANRYVVGVRQGTDSAWYGAGSTRFGSCYDATGYRGQRGNLIALTGPVAGKAADVSPTGNTVTVKARYSSAYKPTQQGDRWIRLREKVPGVRILDAPVVAEGIASRSGVRRFDDVPPGRYYVEVGRRTGCADWYPSRFTNNRKYFKGSARKAEGWKSFRTLRQLPGGANSGLERIARRADPNPASGTVHNRVPKGYQGWMYRGYCKARGAGTINTLTVKGTGRTLTKVTSRNRQGAVVKGRVTRTGGRTNQEIMVRLTSSKGTRVVRTGITDSKGTFYIAGLTSGNWRVSVNSDSWRGIGRSFTGRKTVRVKAGKGYNIGTLKFGS